MKKNILLFVIAFMLFPTIIFAKDTLYVECAKDSLKVGESTNCDVKAQSNENIISVDFTVSVDGNLNLVSAEKNDEWEGEVNNYRFPLYWSNMNRKSVTFGTIEIEAVNNGKEDGKIVLNHSDGSEVNGIELGTLEGGAKSISTVEKLITVSGQTNSGSSPFIPIGIAAGVVVLGAIIIVVAKKKK